MCMCIRACMCVCVVWQCALSRPLQSVLLIHCVRYMSPAKLGDVLTLDAKCVKAGKKVAFATMDIVNKETGAVIAQGRQTKFLG